MMLICSDKSAERIESRQETDTIELIDDIRYYLDQRFRMRMDDLDAEDMYDEDAGVPDNTPAAISPDEQKDGAMSEKEVPHHHQIWTDEEIQADFMRAEALKFDELLGRIDLLLGTCTFHLPLVVL